MEVQMSTASDANLWYAGEGLMLGRSGISDVSQISDPAFIPVLSPIRVLIRGKGERDNGRESG